ncbi:MAG: 5-formyltetrahydrofolate cyclo-ligase [Candidatus Peribacteraceae bacterium]|nr:5-formyltetrahydrofolate cyclo-ligase [Candidatus Peribacteraceae bacterium]
MEAKIELRRAIKERLSHVSAKQRETESRIMCRTLEKLLTREHMTITGYVPFADEPDIVPFLHSALEKGHTVLLPAIEHNALVFRAVKSIDEAKKNPITNLMEPPTSTPVADRKAIDLVITPGRAFTRKGLRMGRGNGGYDHWIHGQRIINPQTRYIGICFECQLVSDLPMEAHDEKMNGVMTDRGLIEMR